MWHQVIVSDNRVKVLMRNFPVSTRWHHWREEIELFCANYCSMVEKSLGVVSGECVLFRSFVIP